MSSARKYNLLLLLTSSYGGGIERGVLDYVKQHSARMFNLSVITLRKGNIEEQFVKICKEHNVPYTSLDCKVRFSPLALFKLLHFVKREKIDIVHARLIEAELFASIGKLFRKYVYISSKHNTDDFRKQYFWGFFDNLITRNADRVIVVSQAIKRFLNIHERIPKDRMEVIYNGIDTKEFTKRVDAVKKRKELGLQRGDFVIGIVGRLVEQKNHLLLFKAVKQLRRKIPHIKLLVIGDGHLKEELQAWVEQQKMQEQIRLLGYRTDVSEIYHAMDIFCMPSRFEGFGRVNLEALLAGTYVLTTMEDGIKEILADNKDFAIKSESDIVAKALWVSKHPKKAAKIVSEEQQRVKKVFGLQGVIKRLERVYAEELRQVESCAE